MKVNRIVILIVIITVLTFAGIWLGINLMQKNSQPVAIVQISKNNKKSQKNNVFLAINRKNKVIFVNFFENNKNFAQQKNKILGESLEEFFDTYFNISDQSFDQYMIEIFASEQDKVLCTKKIAKKSFSKQNKSQLNKNLNFLSHIQVSNLEQKYSNFDAKFDKSKNGSENEYVKQICENMQKNSKN